MTTDNEIKLPYHVTDQDENELRVHRTTRPGRAWVRVGQGNDHRSVYVAPEKVERLCRAIYLATGLEWPAQVTAACRAMYSPGENTRYDCTRARNHRGPHLDDTQNTLWFTGWDPDGHGYRQTEPVTSHDDMESVSRTNHRTEIIGLLEEIRDRLPEPMVTLPTCGDLRPGSHPMEFCQETGDHTRHRNGTSTWPRPHRGPGDLNRSV